MISDIRIVRGVAEGPAVRDDESRQGRSCLLQFREMEETVFEISFQYTPLDPADILRFKGVLNYRGAGKTYTEKLQLAPGVALTAQGRRVSLVMSGVGGGEFRLTIPEKLSAVVDTLLDEVLAL